MLLRRAVYFNPATAKEDHLSADCTNLSLADSASHDHVLAKPGRPGTAELNHHVEIGLKNSNVWREQMKKILCVFNKTRESFLGLNVVVADTMCGRLRGLLGRIKFAPEDGIWLVPSSGIHTFGMLFPVDLVYLDDTSRVIHLVEHLGPFRISAIRQGCSSVLQLRTRTIYSSHTKVGDQLLICSPEEMAAHLEDTPVDGSRNEHIEGGKDVQQYKERTEALAGSGAGGRPSCDQAS